ncbi:hypothetical protein Xclt_08630 [Xanthomonas axonopodis pv. clitoriae]|uniref:Uncharacterized protein n=1 Tax=Xanthomonas axonopodis pv. clitoriae TaxID=487828 RepID=A0AB73P9P1_9XANT|nr:hypothetical protein Xclt_08630 [Xanthomonas axonopodis pv. clitoriae]
MALIGLLVSVRENGVEPVDRNRSKAHIRFDLLELAFVINFDTDDVAIFEDIIQEKLANFRSPGSGVKTDQ